MNTLRSPYLKVLPLIFLFGLLLAGLQGFRDSLGNGPGTNGQRVIDFGLYIARYVVILMAIGRTFHQLKAAFIALGASVLLLLAGYFLASSSFGKTQIFYSFVFPILFNEGLPLLVFGFLCFKKPGLRYFIPLWLFSLAAFVLYAGSRYLEFSPYTGWFRLFRKDEFPALHYTYAFIWPIVTFIMTGEAYTAASTNKSWPELFYFDLKNNYTKAGAITLFMSLRLLINLLVIGLFTAPVVYYYDSVRIVSGMAPFIYFLLFYTGGLLLLTTTVLYYRRFLVEYFIANRQKIQWLYYAANLPIIGLLIFPFVALTANNQPQNRTRFFFGNAQYNLQPKNIMGAILALHLIAALFTGPLSYHIDLFWLLWVVEAALLIWYVFNITGYYVILGFAIFALLLFLCRLPTDATYITALHRYRYSGMESYGLLFNTAITHWFMIAFGIVQYVILLPVFHLHAIKTVQSEEPDNPDTTT